MHRSHTLWLQRLAQVAFVSRLASLTAFLRTTRFELFAFRLSNIARHS